MAAVTLLAAASPPSLKRQTNASASRMFSVRQQMLMRIAEAFEQDVEARLGKMTSMMEPLMLVVMGVGVGFIVMSILQPLMDMSSQ